MMKVYFNGPKFMSQKKEITWSDVLWKLKLLENGANEMQN